jgi:hypothetical protein
VKCSTARSVRYEIIVVILALGVPWASTQDLSSQAKAVLALYTTCAFADGLQIVKVDPLSSGVTFRTVDTGAGQQRIDMAAGLRVMFAYPDADFYANVKVESLPAVTYSGEKKALVDNWQYLHMTNPGTTLNYTLASPLNNFDIRGFDREKLEGGVLGIYLMFDDSSYVVSTFYFLNQDPRFRKFKSIEEYRKIRDAFLPAYTACIRANQKKQP